MDDPGEQRQQGAEEGRHPGTGTNPDRGRRETRGRGARRGGEGDEPGDSPGTKAPEEAPTGRRTTADDNNKPPGDTEAVHIR